MAKILSAVLAKLAALFVGWLWKKREESENAKHEEAIAQGEQRIANENDAADAQADEELAQGAQLAADVRAADDGGGGLRAGRDALQRAIDRSKGGVS